jgi:hypothetical protein
MEEKRYEVMTWIEAENCAVRKMGCIIETAIVKYASKGCALRK